jgi:hypothetical protein
MLLRSEQWQHKFKTSKRYMCSITIKGLTKITALFPRIYTSRGGKINVVVRGLHGQQTRLAVLRQGGIMSEGILQDALPHSARGFPREGAVVIQVSWEAMEQARKDHPHLFYRIVARVARIVSGQASLWRGKPGCRRYAARGCSRDHRLCLTG